MEMALLQRIEDVSDQVSEVAVAVAKLDGVPRLLRDHETRVKKLESWQARLIGAYMAGALLLGVAFQLVMQAVR